MLALSLLLRKRFNIPRGDRRLLLGISSIYSTDMMCLFMFLILKGSLEKSDLLLIPINKRKSHWCLGLGCGMGFLDMFNCLLYPQSSGTEHLMYRTILFQ